MSTLGAHVDRGHYGKLLARTLPAVIRTEAENRRLTAELRALDRRYDRLTPEEKELADLMTVLIESYEERHYALDASTPHSRLYSLMEEHGMRQRDLLPVFGSRGVASEVVNGKRAISKAQAKRLARLFHVPADLFL